MSVLFLDSSVAQSGDVASLVVSLRDLTPSGLNETALQQILTSTRRLQSGLEALMYRVTAEADRLASQGKSAPADELLGASGQLRGSSAKRQARRSRTVATIAGLDDAVWSGDISSDHIDTLTQRLKRLSDEERAKVNTDQLVTKARRMPADQFDSAVKNEINRIRNDHGLKNTLQKRKASEFRHWFDHKTGMGKFSGMLDPERYESPTSAIDQHVNTLAATNNAGSDSGSDSGSGLVKDAVVKDAALAAAALSELVCSSPKRSANLPHITIVVDHKTIAEGGHDKSICQTGNGHHVPPETIERFSCNAVLQKVVQDNRGIPINVGRKYRTATDTQWTAIRTIYSGCAWQDCDRPLSWCQLHHINEWKHGGTTDLNNLVPLCNTHHHRVHEGKWSIKLKPDRSLNIWRPDKTLHTTTRPPNRIKSPDIPPNELLRTG